MKNLSYIFNGILVLAIAVLYFLHFSNTKEISTNKTVGTDSTTSFNTSPNIVYVNSDSLLNNYSYYHKIKTQMEIKSKNAEADLMRRQKSLQSELQKYQENGGTMTMDQRQKAEESLQRKDMELRAYGQSLSQNLQAEEAKLTEDLFNKVSDFLKKYAEGKPYQYILSYSKQSNILFATDSLDITKDVLKGLNESKE